MQNVVVYVKGEKKQIPVYITEGSAGADLMANESGLIKQGEIKLIKTGIFLEIPEGYEAQVRPRSGLAIKHGVTVLNAPGTIDSDYRGEVGVILINHSKNDFFYNKGDRIAQLIFSKVIRAKFVKTENISETQRGSRGFGHSGV